MTTHAIVSGYFNPLHVGHLSMMEAAAGLGDRLIVIVNNDDQQVLKKGKVIISEQDRLRLVQALSIVDEALLSFDKDGSVAQTLLSIRTKYPEDMLIFANGGDRSNPHEIAESEVCHKNHIHLEFGVGGDNKHDSSSRINAELGLETV